KEIERTQYTPEMLAEIDRLYAEEYVRGAAPRFWEEVEEGEELPTVVKGPLLVTDIISAHMGRGWGGFGVAPLKLGYKNRRRVPKFYTPNPFGVPDAAMRCHWEDEWAQAMGHPFAYDYGAMRDSWLSHLVTNWMGDDGWLWKIHTETRRFNYIGDTHWMQGKVTKKFETEWGGAVDLEIWGKNQRDEVTCPGHATV